MDRQIWLSDFFWPWVQGTVCQHGFLSYIIAVVLFPNSPAKQLWYPGRLEVSYADEEWRKTAPPFFATLTSLDVWLLGQQPITENFDSLKTPTIPITIPNFNPRYLFLTDEENYYRVM